MLNIKVPATVKCSLTNGWMKREMDGYVGGWMDGRMGGWIDGWIDE